MNIFRNISKKRKMCLFFIGISLFFIPLQNTYAFWGVGDITSDPGVEATTSETAATDTVTTEQTIQQVLKDYVLDVVVYNIAQKLATKLVSSTVNWANGGFKGNPMFVNDFGSYFGNINKQSTLGTIGQLQSLQTTNPYARSIILNLVQNYNQPLAQQLQPTLNTVLGPTASQAFQGGNFSAGGWQGWLALAQPQNNLVGSKLLVYDNLQNQIQQKTQAETAKLTSSGFLPQQTCLQNDATKAAQWARANPEPKMSEYGVSSDPEAVKSFHAAQNAYDAEKTKASCVQFETKTPSSTIQGALDKALGVPQDRLAQAKEFKELLSASLSQLITGLASAGLRSLTNTVSNSFNGGSVGGPNTLGITTDGSSNWQNLPTQIVDFDEIETIFGSQGNPVINTIAPANTAASFYGQSDLSDPTNPLKLKSGTPRYGTSNFNKIEAAIWRTDQEIRAIQDTILISKTMPNDLMTLDQCIPGPDAGFSTRLQDKAIAFNTSDDEGDINKFEGIKLDAAQIADDMESQMSDPNKNIRMAAEGLAFVKTNAKRYSSFQREKSTKSAGLTSTLGRLKDFQKKLNNVDQNPAPATGAEINQMRSEFVGMTQTISTDESLEQAWNDLHQIQFEQKRVKELTDECIKEKNGPSGTGAIVTIDPENATGGTFIGSKIQRFIYNVKDADNDKKLFCSIDPWHVNEIDGHISCQLNSKHIATLGTRVRTENSTDYAQRVHNYSYLYTYVSNEAPPEIEGTGLGYNLCNAGDNDDNNLTLTYVPIFKAHNPGMNIQFVADNDHDCEVNNPNDPGQCPSVQGGIQIDDQTNRYAHNVFHSDVFCESIYRSSRLDYIDTDALFL